MEACFTSHKKSENSYSLGVGVEDVYLLLFFGGEDKMVVNYNHRSCVGFMLYTHVFVAVELGAICAML